MKRRLTIWSRLLSVVNKANRLASDYSKAIVLELRRPPRTGCRRSAMARVFGLFRARSRYGLGPFYYSLYHLSVVPEAVWPDYLTDNPSKTKLRLINSSDIQVAHNKALMYEHCLMHDLDVIPILCIVGSSPDPLRGLIRTANSLETWRRAMRNTRGPLFVKQIAGSYGEGAFVARPKGDELEFDGRLGSLDELYYHIDQKCEMGDGWIVQPWVAPHPGLRRYVSPNALPTIRAVTATADHSPQLLLAVFKITVGSNVTDNFAKGTSGNLLTAIDIATGRLACAWGSRRADWPDMAAYRLHPDSKAPIEGQVLPCWDQVVELATKAQASLPTFNSIGWDIAIGESGPVLIEANALYDISILQIAHQRGLRRELEEAWNRS